MAVDRLPSAFLELRYHPLMVTSVSTLLDAARGDLVLRILGTARHGQVVRVRAPKCTIGAGPRCTVRLRARGLSSVHCLILRGAGTTIIRRWAPDTLLNGQTFTDAPLVPGDRLSLGRIQLEVLAPEATGLPPAVAPPEVTVVLPCSGGAEPQLTALQTRLLQTQRQGRQRVRRLLAELRLVKKQIGEAQEASNRLAQAEAQAHAELADREQQIQQLTARLQTRERELTAQIEQLRADLAELESQRQQWRCQQTQQSTEAAETEEQSRRRIAELEARQQCLQTECETLRQKQAEWELATAESYTSHQEQAQELAHQQATLAAETEALTEARRRWEAEQTEAQQRAARQAAELATQETQLQAAVAAFEQQQRQWEQEQEQLRRQQEQGEAELAEHRQALDAQGEELQTQRQALEQERQRWEREQAEWRQNCEASHETPAEPAEAESGSSPVSQNSLEVLHRLGMVPPADDEPEEVVSQEPLPKLSSSERAIAPRALPAGAKHGEHEDESVDAYMARLLQRVRGEAPSPPPEPESPPVPAEEPAPAPVLARIKPATPVSLAPRAVAPEKTVDLAAMRQLANYSAQVALGQHAQGQMARERRLKLAVVGVSLLTGGLLLSAWWFRSAPMVTLHAANVSFLIALIWGVQYAILTGHMIVNRAGHLRWVSEPKKQAAGTADRVPDFEYPGLSGNNEIVAPCAAEAEAASDESAE